MINLRPFKNKIRSMSFKIEKNSNSLLEHILFYAWRFIALLMCLFLLHFKYCRQHERSRQIFYFMLYVFLYFVLKTNPTYVLVYIILTALRRRDLWVIPEIKYDLHRLGASIRILISSLKLFCKMNLFFSFASN